MNIRRIRVRRSAFGYLAAAALVAITASAAFASIAVANQPKIEPEGGTYPIKIVGSGGVGRLLTFAEGSKTREVVCAESKAAAEFRTFTSVQNVQVKFTGCTATGPFGIKLSCNSAGAASGEIVTAVLKGKLVYLKATGSEAGIDLETETAGASFVEIKCGGIQSLKVTGSVIGKLTPVNSLTKTYTLTFAQSAGHQAFENYFVTPNGACTATKDVLTTVGSGFESFTQQSAIEGTETLTFSKAIKVNSANC
jgi:hypothetical protein